MNDLSIEQILEWPELADVMAELEDPRFGGRSHGSRATYAKHCHGPLCSKVERDRGRVRNESRAAQKKRDYRPSEHRLSDRDELLDAIIVWHKKQMALKRLGAA